MNKRAAIYTRFSPRSNADDCQSCEHQASRCVSYCNKMGYDVGQIFSDKSVSGGELNRPQLNLAIEWIQKGMVLVVDRNDRLARDMLVSLTIQHEIQKRGATVEFADGSPLQNNPEGRLFQNILSAFAQFEREKFSERTKNGLARKKAAGVWCGRPPIGWTKKKGQDSLVENPSEKSAIDTMRFLHKFGHNSTAIASILNENGSCRGRPWSSRTIRRILSKST